ncbi:hypothetical protein [Methylophaga thalassica]|uniref:hypothetical protein n=1 Tax=Methylophaga aminisulfidivorans TaxID=230105 RepID=UPI003A91FCDE
MPSTNYELFNEIAGEVLVHLLSCFPMSSKEPVGTITKYRKSGDDIPHEWEVFNQTVAWLEAEGFIRSKSSTRQTTKYMLPDCVLTLKGLEALKSIPDPINPDSGDSLADSMVQAVEEGAKDKLKELTKKGLSSLYMLIQDSIT